MHVGGLARWAVWLYFVQVALCQVGARYTNSIRPEDANLAAQMTIHEGKSQLGSSRARERTLYQMLISALGNTDLDNYAIEAAEGEKRDNYKQAKPCYWSLVSCYKKRGYVYVGKRK